MTRERKIDEKFMRQALRIGAQELERDEMPVGSVVVRSGECIGSSNGAYFKSKQFNHAEMIALNEASLDYGKNQVLTVYTTLEPCVMCLGAILHFRVQKVVYALSDPYGGSICLLRGSMPVRHRVKAPEIVSGVLREESKKILKEFFLSTKDDFWAGNTKNPLVKFCLK